MIRVRIEMCPRGDERSEAVTEIGRMYIANVGGTAKSGNYDVAVCRRGTTKVPAPINPQGPAATRSGAVAGYPRLAYNVWRLIARAALACFPEERLVACEPTGGDSATDEHRDPTDEEVLELGREIAGDGATWDTVMMRYVGRGAWLRGARPRGF